MRIEISRWAFLCLLAANGIVFADRGFEPHYVGRLDKGIGAPSWEGNRKKVSRTTEFPERTVGQLEVGCSGTLIGPKHVLTAAHCVYEYKKKEFCKELQFAAARNGKHDPFGVVDFETAYVSEDWKKEGDDAEDYALVILSERIGEQLGWMGFAYDEEVEEMDVELLGYPEDKPEGTMWRSTCPVAQFEKSFLHYSCDTAGGSSGSGVTALLSADRLIYGIHTLGGDEYNTATRLTKATFSKIQGWKRAHP